MADQLNQVPSSLEPISTVSLGDKDIPTNVSPIWYKFFVTISSLFNSGGGGGGAGASAILDTLGSQIGGMLSRFGGGWQEFVASAPNQIPVMNPGGIPITLKTASQILDLISNVRGSILYRAAGSWQVLAPVVGGYLQSQGPGADPQYAASTSGSTVQTGLAATGTTQGTALILTAGWSEVDTTPANSGVVLPALGVGQASTVFNEGVNTLKIYPPVGGQIDSLGVDNPYSLATTKVQSMFQLTATQWRSTQLG